MESQNKNILEKIRTNKKLQAIIISIFAIILLAIIIINFKPNSESNNSNNEIDNYVQNLETKLEKTLSTVKGAGKVSVVITIESGKETVIAKKTTTIQTENGITTEDTPILVNGKVVTLKELYPKIIGVLIVCEGANNFNVVYNIQQATVSLLNINVNQIEILDMK